jgi:hypothetical protein
MFLDAANHVLDTDASADACRRATPTIPPDAADMPPDAATPFRTTPTNSVHRHVLDTAGMFWFDAGACTSAVEKFSTCSGSIPGYYKHLPVPQRRSPDTARRAADAVHWTLRKHSRTLPACAGMITRAPEKYFRQPLLGTATYS